MSDIPAGLLDHRVPVDVAQQAQTEAVRAARVGEAVHGQTGLRGVEGLSDAARELVVADGAPEGRLAVGDRLSVHCDHGRRGGRRQTA